MTKSEHKQQHKEIPDHTTRPTTRLVSVARSVQVAHYQKQFQAGTAFKTSLTFHPWLCYTC